EVAALADDVQGLALRIDDAAADAGERRRRVGGGRGGGGADRCGEQRRERKQSGERVHGASPPGECEGAAASKDVVSRQQLLDPRAGNVGQAEVAALELVRQLQVVESEQVQDRRVQVVDVDRLFGDVPAQLVGLAEHLAALDAAAGHPQRERERVVVAAG